MKKIAGKFLIALAVSSMIVTPVYATPSVDDLKEEKEEAKEQLESLKDDLSVVLRKITEMEEKLIKKGEEIVEVTKQLEEAKIKEREPNVKRVFCVPQEKYIRKNAPYFNREDYDEIIYLEPSFVGWYKSIYFRNCAMVDKSDFIIFHVENRKNSGAYKTYQYALKKKKDLINLI